MFCPIPPTLSTRAAQLAICGLLLLLATDGAQASSFSVSPVRLSLSSIKPMQAVRLVNRQAHPVTIETEVLAWRQVDPTDTYEPTRDLLVSPPIFTVGPGEEQIVRVALRDDTLPSEELAFRVFFTEIPPRDTGEGGAIGIRVALRLGVPVFASERQASEPRLFGSLVTGPNGPKLALENVGSHHVRVIGWELSNFGRDADAATPIATATSNLYIMAARTRSISLPVDTELTDLDALELTVRTSEQTLTVPLVPSSASGDV